MLPLIGAVMTRSAPYEDLPDIAFCLQRNNVHRQFAPIWREADLRDPGLMLGLRPSDFTVVDRDGRLSAVVALWDQRPFKQSVIRDYKPWMRAARPVYNLLAPVLNMPRLPAVGQPVRAAWLSHLAVDQDDLGETLAVVCAGDFAQRLFVERASVEAYRFVHTGRRGNLAARSVVEVVRLRNRIVFVVARPQHKARVMAEALHRLAGFLGDAFGKPLVTGIEAAGEAKVLEYQQAQFITQVIEVVGLVDPASPHP